MLLVGQFSSETVCFGLATIDIDMPTRAAKIAVVIAAPPHVVGGDAEQDAARSAAHRLQRLKHWNGEAAHFFTASSFATVDARGVLPFVHRKNVV